MSRPRAARQSRGGAATGPDAGPSDRADSRIDGITPATGSSCGSSEEVSPRRATAEAEILVCTVMWLAEAADWLVEALERDDPAGIRGAETIALRSSDIERLHLGLSRCVELLDVHTVASAALPPPEPADADVAVPPSVRTLQ